MQRAEQTYPRQGDYISSLVSESFTLSISVPDDGYRSGGDAVSVLEELVELVAAAEEAAREGLLARIVVLTNDCKLVHRSIVRLRRQN